MKRVSSKSNFYSPKNNILWYGVIALIVGGVALGGIYYYNTDLMLLSPQNVELECGASEVIEEKATAEYINNPDGLYVLAGNNQNAAYTYCWGLLDNMMGGSSATGPSGGMKADIKHVGDMAIASCEAKLSNLTISCPHEMICGTPPNEVSAKCYPFESAPSCSVVSTDVVVDHVARADSPPDSGAWYCYLKYTALASGSKNAGCTSCAEQ